MPSALANIQRPVRADDAYKYASTQFVIRVPAELSPAANDHRDPARREDSGEEAVDMSYARRYYGERA